MENIVLRELLKEYEKKRITAIKNAELKKSLLYSSNKDLKDLENTLNKLAIDTSKVLLNSFSNEQLELLKNKINILKNKKNAILNTLDIDENYFYPNYECSFCNDTGYINNNIMCSCLKQKLIDIEYNKSNIANLNKENFNTFNLNLYSNDVNENKYKSKLSPRKNIEIIKNLALSFVKNFNNFDEKNILFTGNTGLGKTFLSNCIAKEIIEKGNTVLYQTAPTLIESIVDFKFGKKNISEDFYKNVLNVNLLIIDDLGTENINNIKFTELFNIINTRLLNQNNKITKTIISTNLTLQNILSTYDERITSRIIGNYNICKFFGDDIRFKK